MQTDCIRRQQRDKKDFYQTPVVAVEALWLTTLKSFPKESIILDPCKGGGVIGGVLREAGFENIREIEKYPVDVTESPVDFLEYDRPVDIIVGNPPYSQKYKFIDHALTLADYVFFIFPVAMISYNNFHTEYLNRPEYIGRVLLTPKFFMDENDRGRSIKRGGSGAYAWFCWSKRGRDSNGSMETYYNLDALL